MMLGTLSIDEHGALALATFGRTPVFGLHMMLGTLSIDEHGALALATIQTCPILQKRKGSIRSGGTTKSEDTVTITNQFHSRRKDEDHDGEDNRSIARRIDVSSDCCGRQRHGVWTLSRSEREESVWMDAEQKDYSQGSASLANDETKRR
jgi:hypothetical protein